MSADDDYMGTPEEWRISMHGPLSGQEYQRQGDGHWVLIRRDEGFA